MSSSTGEKRLTLMFEGPWTPKERVRVQGAAESEAGGARVIVQEKPDDPDVGHHPDDPVDRLSKIANDL